MAPQTEHVATGGAPVDTQTLIDELHQLRTKAAVVRARAVDRREPPAELLDEALTELGVALEELRLTEEELRRQNDRVVSGLVAGQAEHMRLAERFAGAPDACLETDRGGLILAANVMAGQLLGSSEQALVGKPLAGFVVLDERRRFRGRLSELPAAGTSVQRWLLRVQGLAGTVRQVDVRLRLAPPAPERDQVVWWALTPVDQEAVRLTTEPTPADAETVVSALGGDAQTMLGQIVDLAAALFRAAGAGVMLVDPDGLPRWVTASDARAKAFEQAQAALDQGPCIDALRTTEVVSTPDVASDPRWPELSRLIRGQGIGGVLCAPLVLDDRPVGSFNVFSDGELAWDREDETVAEHFAGMVVRLLRTRIDLKAQQSLAVQLQHALQARVVIEQAKGVIMARRGLSAGKAWVLLRDTARRSHQRAAELAARVVDEGDLPGHEPATGD